MNLAPEMTVKVVICLKHFRSGQIKLKQSFSSSQLLVASDIYYIYVYINFLFLCYFKPVADIGEGE